MKTLEVVVLHIYIPNDEAHLERVLQAIKEFRPGGDVRIHEVRSVFDLRGERLPIDQQKSLEIEFMEEQCRAQIFVDAMYEDMKPVTILGSFMTLLEGDEPAVEAAIEQGAGEAGAQG